MTQHPTTTTVAHGSAAICGDSAVLASDKGESAVSDAEREALKKVVTRRLKYIARFAYWLALHRSPKHVAWVLAFEGYSWN